MTNFSCSVKGATRSSTPGTRISPEGVTSFDMSVMRSVMGCTDVALDAVLDCKQGL